MCFYCTKIRYLSYLSYFSCEIHVIHVFCEPSHVVFMKNTGTNAVNSAIISKRHSIDIFEPLCLTIAQANVNQTASHRPQQIKSSIIGPFE